MILRILSIVAVGTLIIFLLFWLVTGGFARGIATARAVGNPFSLFISTSTGSGIHLPWEPDTTQFGASSTVLDTTIEDYTYTDTAGNVGQKQSLEELQVQYDSLSTQARDAKTFGTPSPYRSSVIFDRYETTGTLSQEYIRIQTKYGATSAISLTGWSLQSAVSGIRVSIPPASSPFVAGSLNNVSSVSLEPDSSMTISTGPSPVGVSFQENQCTGYLAELQSFYPDLDRDCPLPSDILSLSPENIQIYGDTCVDYLRSVPACHFPGKDAMSTISSTCRNFAINQLSYNGCVYAYRNGIHFSRPSWRIYLNSATKLWGAKHDVIRLLEEQSRTVAVLTY